MQTTANLAVTTSREDFRALAAGHRVVPVTRKVLADSETPLSAYRKLAANRPGTFLLESAENGRSWSRWSFIGAGAPSAFTVRDGEAAWLGVTPQDAPSGGDPLQALHETLELLQTEPVAGLPPLSGGLVGFFAYDLVRRLERLPELAVDDLELPDMLLLLATDIAAVDHHEGTITLIANAVNWNGTDERVDWAYDDAVARLDVMTEALGTNLSSTVATFSRPEPLHRKQRSVEEYGAIVERLVGEIEAGEAFQVVPSQRFEMDTDANPLDVYRMLRVTNPSPYMYLLNVPDAEGGLDFSIVGSSPEALVTVKDGRATTHPIAGTRWRGANEEEDLLLEKELQEDEKERAEHLMLVDLGRNDLGRVCVPGTVRVEDYSHIERYSHVMHLVSTVTGQLADGKTALDAVTACFPAGTLTGAPKVRAMELIEEVEKTRRGLYGGVLGYLDFAGNADFAIAIRTALMRSGHGVCAGRRGSRGRLQRAVRVQRGREQGQGGAERDRRGGDADRAMKHIGQLLLLLAAGALWVASRMTWVEVSSFDGLGQPETATLNGGAWSTALVPLALMLLAAVLKSTVGPRWQLRLLAVVVGGMSAVMAYLAISLWVVRDIAVRAAGLAEVPVADLVGTQRHYWGAVVTLVAAVLTLAGAVLLMRAPVKDASDDDKYEAPARRREAARRRAAAGDDMSERMMWDALDEGRDPTKPDTEGR